MIHPSNQASIHATYPALTYSWCTEVFPGQLRDIISQGCLVSARNISPKKHLGGIQITCPEPPPLTSINVENQWLYSELLTQPLYVQNINIHPSLQGPVHSTSPHGFLMRTNCTCCPLKLALKNKAHLIGIQCSARFFFLFSFLI